MIGPTPAGGSDRQVESIIFAIKIFLPATDRQEEAKNTNNIIRILWSLRLN
jgi:hypothetical protein